MLDQKIQMTADSNLARSKTVSKKNEEDKKIRRMSTSHLANSQTFDLQKSVAGFEMGQGRYEGSQFATIRQSQTQASMKNVDET